MFCQRAARVVCGRISGGSDVQRGFLSELRRHARVARHLPSVHQSRVTDQQILRIGRITTVLLVLWAIGFALALAQLKDGSGVYTVFQTLMSFFQGPAFAILLTGIFWRRATAVAALVGLICGILTAIGLFLCNQSYFLKLVGWEPLFQIADPFLYYSIWSFLVTILLVFMISPFTKPIAAQQAELFFGASRSKASP